MIETGWFTDQRFCLLGINAERRCSKAFCRAHSQDRISEPSEKRAWNLWIPIIYSKWKDIKEHGMYSRDGILEPSEIRAWYTWIPIIYCNSNCGKWKDIKKHSMSLARWLIKVVTRHRIDIWYSVVTRHRPNRYMRFLYRWQIKVLTRPNWYMRFPDLTA